ncbi:hypothetical protein [Nonomuraea sp. B19D2]|uniref:hypothetical protein n=1 Tax=Nonomuraea sp. B19D2 TaxID=3159561 RepID=UPI0032DAA586
MCRCQFTLCARFGERPADLVSWAAAVELAGLAALAQESVSSGDRPARGGRPNWGTMFVVLSADVLLARALELCASGRSDLASIVEDAAIGRMRELVAARAPTPPTPRERLLLASRTGPAALLVAACELGARTSGRARAMSKRVPQISSPGWGNRPAPAWRSAPRSGPEGTGGGAGHDRRLSGAGGYWRMFLTSAFADLYNMCLLDYVE